MDRAARSEVDVTAVPGPGRRAAPTRLREDESQPADLTGVDLLFSDLRIDDADVECRMLLDDPYHSTPPSS